MTLKYEETNFRLWLSGLVSCRPPSTNPFPENWKFSLILSFNFIHSISYGHRWVLNIFVDQIFVTWKTRFLWTILYKQSTKHDVFFPRHPQCSSGFVQQIICNINNTVNYAAFGHVLTFRATLFSRFPAIHLSWIWPYNTKQRLY